MERVAKDIQKHFTYPYRPYKVEIVGSVARGILEPHDIDYLITLKQFDADFLNNVSVSYPYRITELNECGATQCYFKVQKYPKRSILVNLYLTNKESYMFSKFGRLTDKGHLIHYKKLAAEKGYILNNYGLWDKKKKPRKFKSIKDLIYFLEF